MVYYNQLTGTDSVENIVKKVTDYQLFNFLLTGTIFAVAISSTTHLKLVQENVLAALFTYYFLGLVISRVGSLIIEPLLKLMHIVRFAPYAEYLKALKKDPKLDVLSQENNVYRTIISASILFILVFVLVNYFNLYSTFSSSQLVIGGALLLLILFIFSYRKQTSYITKRISRK